MTAIVTIISIASFFAGQLLVTKRCSAELAPPEISIATNDQERKTDQ